MTSFVYVMPTVDDPGLCKVGYSCNPVLRAKQVSACYGVAVTLHAAVECDGYDPRRVESAAHAYLRRDGLCVEGEWFRATPQQAVRAIYLAKRRVRRVYTLGGRLRQYPDAPSEEAFPLFHNESVGFIWLPVWHSTWGLNA